MKILKEIIEDWQDFHWERKITKESVLRYLYRKSSHLELSALDRVHVIYGGALQSPFVKKWMDENEQVTLECIEEFLKRLDDV